MGQGRRTLVCSSSGSADPYLSITDPALDLDYAIFVSDPSRWQLKIICFSKFILLIAFCSYIYIVFFEDKRHKEVTKR